MAERTRLNREIAGQHGSVTQAKAPGRETKPETQEPHAVEGEPQTEPHATEQQTPDAQAAAEPQRRRSVFDAPLQADVDAQSEQANETDADDE